MPGKRIPLLIARETGASRRAGDCKRSGPGVKVYLRTFGCRANHYDTEAVRALVSSAGHEIVSHAADADVAVYNGCAVTADAEAELRKVVRQSAKRRPQLRSIVMGCAASNDEQRAPELRVRSLPTVDHVVPGASIVRATSLASATST